MAEKVSQLSLTRENHHFFVNTTEIPGVQTIRAEYSNNSRLLKALGLSKNNTIPDGFQQGTVSVNSLLLSSDQFIGFTGDLGFNGYLYNNKNDNPLLAFNSGYLTNYSCQYSYGSLPTIDANVTVFNFLGKPLSDSLRIGQNQSSLPLQIPGLGISLNINDFQTNRVLAYTINLACPRTPIYPLGSRLPSYVKLSKPIEVTCNFQIEVNDYWMKSFSDYPFTHKVENLALGIKTYNTNETITNFNFNNLEMQGEALESSINNAQTINVQYKGYL